MAVEMLLSIGLLILPKSQGEFGRLVNDLVLPQQPECFR